MLLNNGWLRIQGVASSHYEYLKEKTVTSSYIYSTTTTPKYQLNRPLRPSQKTLRLIMQQIEWYTLELTNALSSI